MPDALLRLRYTEHDAAGATVALRAVLGSGTVTEAAAGLQWEQESLVDDGITVTRLMSSGPVRAVFTRSAELVVVLVRRGELSLAERDRRAHLAAGEVGLIPLGSSAVLAWDRLQADLVALPPAPLGRLLGVRAEEVQLVAPLLQPRSPALAAHLDRVVGLLTAGTFEIEEVYQRDLVRAGAIGMVAAATVEAFELVNRSERSADRDHVVLRRAVAFMREHLRDPVSVPQIADAAGVSVRGLQLVFRRQLDTTPLLHLRQMRLDAAHDELRQRTSPGTTVAEIASRYGYANAGRFSSHYRNAFTESAAATLARDRDGTDAAAAGPA